jgi:protein-disulfide isomerase
MQKINKSWYKKWWGVLIIIIGTLILINIVAFGFYIYSIMQEMKSGEVIEPNSIIEYAELSEETLKIIEGDNNYWTGSADPKVTIVEFSDFACPYCQNSFPKIREISLKYKDSVKIIFRDMPLQENSLNLAMAGRCAGEQGLFWLMHDRLFQNQGIYKKEDLSELANQIGADVSQFNSCLDSSKYIKQVQKDFSDGENLEIRGTPTWFINGNKVEGDIPYSTFTQIIEQLLQE